MGLDQHQTIVERMARKHIQQPVKTDPRSWRGDLGGEGRILPQEYVAQRLMSHEDAQYVIKNVAAYRYTEETRIARIYMEYAPHGDLHDLLKLHQQAQRRVTEPFLWVVFRALIESAFIMKYGSLDKKSKPKDWLEIVHRDLKPSNILLSTNDSGHFNMYPRPKLSDFGLSILTSEDDTCNPYLYVGASTQGYLAPEQKLFHDPVSTKYVDDDEMLYPCNIWAIGAVMYALMTLTTLDSSTPDRQLPYHVTTDPPTGREFELDLRSKVDAKWPGLPYSVELMHYVQRCLRFQVRDRYTADELLEICQIRFAKSRLLNDLFSGIPRDKPPRRVLHKPETQAYRLGLIYQPG